MIDEGKEKGNSKLRLQKLTVMFEQTSNGGSKNAYLFWGIHCMLFLEKLLLRIWFKRRQEKS